MSRRTALVTGSTDGIGVAIARTLAIGGAQVVLFEGVNKDGMDQMSREMQEGEPPEGFPPAEVVVLHDTEAEKSLVVIFETEDDYRRGDEMRNARRRDSRTADLGGRSTTSRCAWRRSGIRRALCSTAWFAKTDFRKVLISIA
ncbi:MAG: SDR family NAD(P)-dependent oxidoreductase [Gaiellaceae bacterium]